MTTECLDHVERIARLLATPDFGERRRKREQNEKIRILLDAQKKNAELFEELDQGKRARATEVPAENIK